MKNWNINNRVLFITLFPLTVICFALNIYFTSVRISEIETSILKQGTALTFHLANSSEYEMISGNRIGLDTLVQNVLTSNEILAASITDDNNKTIALKKKDQIEKTNILFDYIYDAMGYSSKSMKFTEPIVSETIAVDDYLADGRKASLGEDKSNVIGYANIYISTKISTYRQILNIIKGNLILFLIYLFTVYLSLRLSNDLTLAITDISTTVNQIEAGHLHSRTPEYRGGEIGMLTRGINNMAKRIQESEQYLRQEIEKATANLRNSYVEIEKQNTRLKQARSVADEANKAKSSFLANISHEIRTPVNGIIGFTEILQQSSLTHNQREYTGAIVSASKSLIHLINDLLDFARIESGKMTIENLSFDFYSIFENLYTVYSNTAFEKGLELIVNIDPRIPNIIVSDPIRIEQILINLISNAIKFTQSGYIKINALLQTTSYDDIEIKISVEDTGIGLSKGQISKIFQKFEQADTSISRKYGGTGLGLSICKSVVELLGGTIGVDSIEKSGSKFWFTIKCSYSDQDIDFTGYNYNDRTIQYFDPIQSTMIMFSNLFRSIGFNVTDASDANIPHNQTGKNDLFIYSVDASYNTNASADYSYFKSVLSKVNVTKVAFVSSNNPRIHKKLLSSGFDHIVSKTINKTQLLNTFSTTLYEKKINFSNNIEKRPKSSKPNMRVLIVDDNLINIKILETYLRNIDALVISASNGEEALEKVNQHELDIILMDLHMPVMDGYTATRAIRDLSSTKSHIPIIGITADGMQESIHRSLEAGMNQCLVKPITSTDIEKVIQTWVKQDIKKNQNKTKWTLNENDLTAMLIKELPNYKIQLLTAIEENNHIVIYQVAHKIVGGSAYCNLPELNKHAIKLQDLSKQGDCEAINKHLDILLNLIDKLIDSTIY